MSLICSHVLNKCGLSFKENNLHLLQNGIEKRMSSLGMDDIQKYSLLLRSRGDGDSEIRKLYNLITVNETEFYRDRQRMKALFEKVIPDIVSDRISRSLISEALPLVSVWSAGCSSGEEPYSIAMERKESRPYSPWYDMEILATDISTAALSIARESLYDARKLKNVDEDVVERYFTRTEGGFQLKDSITRLVDFRFHNLVEEPVPQSSRELWDVIVCQNVIIYFDKDTIKRVIEKFYDSLAEGGYLILGFSESLLGIPNGFTAEFYENTAIYRKISRRSDEMPLNEGAADLRSSKNADVAAEKADSGGNDEDAADRADCYTEAVKHFRNDEFDEAQELLVKSLRINEKDEKSQNLLGQVLFEKNMYTEAEHQFKACLALNAFEPSLYYYLGLIYNRLERPEDVIRFLKKALYLDKENALAHMHLADAYATIDDMESARREYRNALKCLRKHGPDRTLPFSKGLKCSSIIEICMRRLSELGTEIFPQPLVQYPDLLRFPEMG
jgi:chemotaxis protein methyltransferase CheR